MPPRLAPPTTLSPPPSPKHHTRRKSAQPHTTKSHGHKPSRPILPSRRTTSTKTASSNSKASPPPAASFPSEIESFFNFCTTCDKQLPATSDLSLYCSSSCRLSDLPSSTASGNGGYAFPASPPLTPFAMTFPVLHERKRSAERDVLPRMSAASYYDAESWYSPPRSERATPALESLRSLSRALEATSSYRPALSVETADTYSNTYALPRRPSFSSSEEEDDDSEEDSDDEEEYQRLHRRVPSTPHPGAAIYGTYLKPASSMETYTNNVQLPGKGSPETWRARGRDLVTPVMG